MRDGRSLLLVDDDETTRDLLSLLLASEGWTVTTADSGDEALRVIADRDATPDVVLSDLQMPGLCGQALATALCNATADQAQPLLIAMTATNKAGMPTGFDDLLIKPFAPSDLLQRCHALWSSGTSATPTGATEDKQAEPVIDTATLERIRASMPSGQVKALYDFALTDAETRIARMSSAAQAGDDETYRSEAHALKGSCGMVGALRLRTLAAAAEDTGLRNAALTESNPLLQLRDEIGQIRHMLESLLFSAS